MIVVDDGSEDDTAEVARRFPVRLVRLPHAAWASNCRNLGARVGRGALIAFLDADQTLVTGTLERIRERLADPEVDAVVGCMTPRTPAPGFFSAFKNFQHHYTHRQAEGRGLTLDSGRMAIRREVFEAVGGFERPYGAASIEDIGLGYRVTDAGGTIWFDPDIQVVHHKGYSLFGLLKSDVMDRAIPWTGLLIRERVTQPHLNVGRTQIASVALAWLLPVLLFVGAVGWIPPALGAVLGAGTIATLWTLSLSFLLAARHELGTRFALGAAAFLPFMYWYHGLGLLLGVGAYAWKGTVTRSREAPRLDYTVSEPE